MKKIFISTILTIILAIGVSAQTTTEQKMLPFAIGMSVSVLGEMYDEQNQTALVEFQQGLAYYSAELKPLADLKKDESIFKRMDVGLSVAKAIRAKANKHDKWLMLVGERFGTIYVQFKKNKNDDEAINADDLRFSLETIGILADNPPSSVPDNIVKKFKEFGKLKDLENITSEKNVKKITDAVLDILSEIME